MTSPRENLPWLFKSLLASIRNKASLYNKAKRTNKADLFLKNKLSESLKSGVISNQNVRMEMVSLL